MVRMVHNVYMPKLLMLKMEGGQLDKEMIEKKGHPPPINR